jgi:hypothetical protein
MPEWSVINARRQRVRPSHGTAQHPAALEITPSSQRKRMANMKTESGSVVIKASGSLDYLLIPFALPTQMLRCKNC